MSFIVEITSLVKENYVERVKVIFVILITLTIGVMPIYQEYEEKQLKKENQVYEVQLETLTEVQESINNLSEFIRTQKHQLKQSQQTVESLKKEHESLKPVVEADRKIVESILMAQDERSRASIWQERLIGFGLGVAGSLIASLILAAVKRGRNA